MEFRSFLGQILTSWQVIAVTIVVVLYIMLASYVAQFRHRAKVEKAPKEKIPKPKKKDKTEKTEETEETEEIEEKKKPSK
ncbi:MAG: hypothetical protein LBL06_02230 [Treponema sp.]|jgi:cytoskeletal protein RodZ|nr:hypothetical protein [Treponema sp.]